MENTDPGKCLSCVGKRAEVRLGWAVNCEDPKLRQASMHRGMAGPSTVPSRWYFKGWPGVLPRIECQACARLS